MNARPLVLYHANCQDGFTAAWCAWKHMPHAEFIPVQYGQEPPDVCGRDLYILDFSYKRPAMERLVRECAEIVVLDHHKTAQADLAGLDDFAAKLGTAHRIRFDMHKCGARLAWEQFCTNQDPPFLIELVQDRDLWQWKVPYSKELNAWLASLERTFDAWDIIANDLSRPYLRRDGVPLGFTVEEEWLCSKYTESAVDQGRAILRYQDQQVDAICNTAREVELGGEKILAANTSVLFSEVAGKFAEGRPFGAAWFIRSDGKKQWSLRSREGGVDVSEVAKRYGGGGHKHAAGFEESPA